MEQRTEEWFQARCGSLGASSLHEVVARTKSGWSTSRANCLARLLVERLTGKPAETYVNAAMQHGIDTEAEARTFYCFMKDVEVQEVGLIKHPRIEGTHASPDGLVPENGLIEIKCPQPNSHLDLLTGANIPHKYVIQAQWQMACTGRGWCDFISYSPVFPVNMRMFFRRIERDDERIKELEGEVRVFLLELLHKLDQLKARYGDLREAA